MNTHLSVSNSLRSHVRVAIINASVTLEAAVPAASAAARLRRLIGRSGSSANRSRWGLFLEGGWWQQTPRQIFTHRVAPPGINAGCPRKAVHEQRQDACSLGDSRNNYKKEKKIHRSHEAAAPDALKTPPPAGCCCCC